MTLNYIYKVTNTINGKIYIGKTHYTVANRWSQHISAATVDSHKVDYNYLLHKAIRKYGREAFIVETLEEVTDESILSERERYWITQYNSCILEDGSNGYNMTYGGEGATKINKSKVESLWDSGLGSVQIAKEINSTNLTIKKILLTYKNFDRNENFRRNTGRKVYQYDSDGILIRDFSSITQAATNVGVDPSVISKCCNGEKQSAGGYFWSYSDTAHFSPKKLKTWKKLEVVQKSLDGQTISIYPSMSAAGRAMNKKQTKYIKECCEGKRENMYGYKWEYSVDKLAVAAAEELKNG